MIAKFKKAFFILLAVIIPIGIGWFFFIPHWDAVITDKQEWEYGFQVNQQPLESVEYELPGPEMNASFSKHKEPFNLVFKSSFFLKDCSAITEGLFEYNYKYSVKVLINGVVCDELDRNLIKPSVDDNNNTAPIKVYEHWRPRKMRLDRALLKRCLKNGENTIVVVINNTPNFSYVDPLNKELLLKSAGIHSRLIPYIKLRRPPKKYSKSELPILKINTFSEIIPDEPKISSSLKIINNLNRENGLSDSSSQYNIAIERRGNTSQSFSKKSYSFNTLNDSLSPSPEPLLTLPTSEKWVLYGPYADKSLIRNALTYTLYKEMGNYAPRFQFIDLVINDNYQGVYLLTEKIQLSPNHLNIPILKIDSLNNFSGGYLLELDRNEWKSNFPLKNNSPYRRLKYEPYSPKKEKIPLNASLKMKEQFNQLEESIYYDRNITTLLDLNSFVDYFIISEFSKNIDAYFLSTFLYNKNIQDSIPKFYIGPIWDYNFAYGLASHDDGYNPDGFVFNGTKKMPFWWPYLYKNDNFKSTLNKRYLELRKSVLSNQNINQKIDSLSNICKSSIDLNFKRWDLLGSTDCWPNYFLGETYEEEIDYLKNWIDQRLVFLDESILKENKNSLLSTNN